VKCTKIYLGHEFTLVLVVSQYKEYNLAAPCTARIHALDFILIMVKLAYSYKKDLTLLQHLVPICYTD
jgi:hypothetical protein